MQQFQSGGKSSRRDVPARLLQVILQLLLAGAFRFVAVLLVALAAAGLASFAVYRAIQQAPVKQVEIPTQTVVVAAKALPVGAMLGPADVRLIAWPAKTPLVGGVARSEDAVGRGLVASVAENEPLTEAKLAPRGAGAGLPPTIPVGMRAISVKVSLGGDINMLPYTARL